MKEQLFFNQNEFEPNQVEKFDDLGEFVNRLDKENEELINFSQEKQARGEAVKDQDFPIRQIHFDAKQSEKAALMIIGGMGPLAGVQAGQAATLELQKTEKPTNVSLYQLTSTPDRTEGIKEKEEGKIEKYNEVIRTIKSGISNATERAKNDLGNSEAKIVIICNTAHNYVEDLQNELPEGQEIVSIIDSASDYLNEEKNENPDVKVAAMYTDGTRKQKLYSRKLEESGVDYEEPTAEDQESLMNAIYKGVKAFDPEKTLEHGEKALEYLVKRDDITHLLAGCTEIPEIINVVKKETKKEKLRNRLEKIQIVDPVEKAFAKVIGEK